MTIIGTFEGSSAASFSGRRATSWSAVVGFDGTEPARAALAVAVDAAREHGGHLEIVYVRHVSLYAAMSADAIIAVREEFSVIAGELVEALHATLDGSGIDWHFHQRDGLVAAQLLAAATELRATVGDEAAVTIIIGSSQHRMHHTVGSVAASLSHETTFPLVMVPPFTAKSTAAGA